MLPNWSRIVFCARPRLASNRPLFVHANQTALWPLWTPSGLHREHRWRWRQCSHAVQDSQRTTQKMRDLKPPSKLWWKKAKEVMKHEAQVGSIPALETNDGVWVLNAWGKANLFADTFAAKCKLPKPRQNVHRVSPTLEIQGSFVLVSEKQCRDTLANFSDESSTSPDVVLARIFKSCAEQLTKPPQILLLRLLETANWPESWREHWIVSIYKKKVFFASNYRGVHLTVQMLKVAERLLLPTLETHISHTVALGPKQFAYTKGRSARGLLTGYGRETSGETPMQRSSPCLSRSGGVPAAATIRSGGRGRPTIGQDASQEHGVSGPRSWTHTLEPFLRGRPAFYHEAGFMAIVCADDLNGFREFEHSASVDSVMTEVKKVSRRAAQVG